MNNKMTALLTAAIMTGVFAASTASADHHKGHGKGDKKHENGCKGHNGCKGEAKKGKKADKADDEHKTEAPAEGTGH